MKYIIKSYWVIIVLCCITLLAALLRLYRVDSIPVSLYWDETASTYNAYSIARTLRDEYGNFLPFLFRSFDDYKMSGNIYLTAAVTLLFGLNEFSARASSAILGTATVLLTYFVITELLSSIKDIKYLNIFSGRSPKNVIRNIALTAAFLLAISPWHIQFSRTGFEANVAVFFTILGMLLFLKGLRKSSLFIVSMIIFALNFYFYRSIQIFLPFLLLILFIVFRKQILKLNRRKVLIGLFLMVFIIAPLIPWMLSRGGLARVRQVNIFTNSQEKVYENAKIIDSQGNGFFSKFVYNRRVVYASEIIRSYLSHFSPTFLFISGDPNGRHGPRGMGVLYIWEIPFVLIGLYVLFKLPRSIKYIVLAWILIAPIPASLSVPTPHALRSLNMLPMPQLLTSFGIVFVFYKFQRTMQFIYCSILLAVITVFFLNYLQLYYDKTARQTSSDWADGYKQLTQYIFQHEAQYDKVLISGHYWQPYIYFLFYKKYDPILYQKYGNSHGFDKYIFGGTSWDKDKDSQELDNIDLKQYARAQRLLVALSPQEYNSQKDEVKKITEIRNHNNELVFIIGEAQ